MVSPGWRARRFALIWRKLIWRDRHARGDSFPRGYQLAPGEALSFGASGIALWGNAPDMQVQPP